MVPGPARRTSAVGVGCSSVMPTVELDDARGTASARRRRTRRGAGRGPAARGGDPATQNSTRLSRQKRANRTSMSPRTATTTMQARTASGRSLRMPPRNRAQATASATVTSSLSWVRAPARWLMAVCENPPAAGMARKKAPAREASPLAASSWSLSIGGSDGRRTARATASVSRKTMMAMAKAPGIRSSRWSTVGAIGVGESARDRGDEGDAVLVERGHVDQHDAADDGDQRGGDVGRQTAQPEEDGERARREGDRGPADVVEVLADVAQVGEEVVRGRVARHAEQVGQLAGGDGEPDPDLDPGEGGFGDVVDQRCRAAAHGATSSTPPTSSVRVATARAGSSAPAATPAARRLEAVRMAIVEVVDTDSAGPAEQRVHGHRHHARYRPTSVGRLAMVAYAIAWGITTAPAATPPTTSLDSHARSYPCRHARRAPPATGSCRGYVVHRRPVVLDADDRPAVSPPAAARSRRRSCSRTPARRRRGGRAAAAPGSRRRRSAASGCRRSSCRPATSGRRPMRLQIRTGFTGPSSKTSGSASSTMRRRPRRRSAARSSCRSRARAGCRRCRRRSGA